MTFLYRRTFGGPVRAVVLDWAGTTVDHGSRAPAGVFCEVFRRAGVDVTDAEARGPMGMQKREHIKQMASLPRVSAAWREVHGRDWTEGDIDEMYASFVPLQIEVVGGFADVLPGVAVAVERLREDGVRIGSSTGYNRAIMDIVAPIAARQGYAPDALVTSDDVHAGRPAPWMLLENARRLDGWPVASLVKVDDTITGIEAGLNAGAWSVGVAATGNMMGLSADELAGLDDGDREARLEAARVGMRRAGAHYVIDSVASLAEVVDDINDRLAAGDTP